MSSSNKRDFTAGLVLIALLGGLLVFSLLYQQSVIKTGCRFVGTEIVCVQK